MCYRVSHSITNNIISFMIIIFVRIVYRLLICSIIGGRCINSNI